jgi:hypothetical protein
MKHAAEASLQIELGVGACCPVYVPAPTLSEAGLLVGYERVTRFKSAFNLEWSALNQIVHGHYI